MASCKIKWDFLPIEMVPNFSNQPFDLFKFKGVQILLWQDNKTISMLHSYYPTFLSIWALEEKIMEYFGRLDY